MKKSILVIGLCTFLMSGCSISQQSTNTDKMYYKRSSTVVQITKKYIIGRINSDTTNYIPKNALHGTQVKVGDKITATYDYVTKDVVTVEVN